MLKMRVVASASPNPRHMRAGSFMPPHLLRQHLLSPLHTPAIQLSLSLLWHLEHRKFYLHLLSSFCQQIQSSAISPVAVLPCLCSHRLSFLLKKKDSQWQQAEIVPLKHSLFDLGECFFFTSFCNWCKNLLNTGSGFRFAGLFQFSEPLEC